MLADPGEAWWISAFEWNREGRLCNRAAIYSAGLAHTPITMGSLGGLHVSIHEAVMNLARAEDRRFRAALMSGLDAAVVLRAMPFASPWRTI